MTEKYFNPNERRYPTRHDVVKVVEKWGESVCPEYSLAALSNTNVSSFVGHFHDPASGMTLRVYLTLYPNQHKDYPGWHVRNARIDRLSKDVIIPDHGVEVYPPCLETLMMAYPKDRIVHIDNEDDDWPAFGWAVAGNAGFKAFIQHARDEEEPEYWKNPDLPYVTIVTHPITLFRLNEDMWEHTLNSIRDGLSGAY